MIILLILIYFIPFFVALIRQHNQSFAIGMLNLLLGWSIIGWVVALVWACIETANYSNISSADEIRKLAELKEQGILSEEEFNKKKNELLNSD